MKKVRYPTAQEWVRLSRRAQELHEIFNFWRTLGEFSPKGYPISYVSDWSRN